MKKIIVAGLASAVLIASANAAPPAPPPPSGPVGEWLTKDGDAHIRIVPCGDAMWGIISWEKTPGKDDNNPDPAKQTRPVLGIPILLHMKMAKPNRWDGEVYNAENGKIYTADISLASADVLEIEGCVLGVLCDGEKWTRLPPAPASVKPEPEAQVCARVTKDQ